MNEIRDVDAERHVLGSLIDPLASPEDAKRLRGAVFRAMEADDLTEIAHVEIYNAIRKMSLAGEVITPPSVLARLTTKGAKVAALKAAEDAISWTQSAPDLARRVAMLAKRRRIRSVALETARAAGENLDDDDAVSGLLGRFTREIAGRRGEGSDQVSDWMVDVFRDIEDAIDNGRRPGVLTGFSLFDEWGGLDRGLPHVVAGRPGSGKTGLACSMTFGAASVGEECLLLSLEMSKLDLGKRIMAGVCNLPLWRLRDPRKGKLDGPDMVAIHRGMAQVDAAMEKIRAYAPSRMSLGQLEDFVLAEHAIRPLNLVVLDYLTLVKGTDVRTREREIAEVSNGLRELAKETGAAFLVLSQLNRALEGRVTEPNLSDLRDSGQIEQDAASVAVVVQHRKNQDTDEIEKLEAERDIYVLKRRNGPPTQVGRVLFRGDRGAWFSELETWP